MSELNHHGIKGMRWGVRNDTSGGSGESKPGLSTKKKVAIGLGVAAVGAAAAAVVVSRRGSLPAIQLGPNSSAAKRHGSDALHKFDHDLWKQNVAKLSADIHASTKAQDAISRQNLNRQVGQKITDPDLRKRFGLPA